MTTASEPRKWERYKRIRGTSETGERQGRAWLAVSRGHGRNVQLVKRKQTGRQVGRRARRQTDRWADRQRGWKASKQGWKGAIGYTHKVTNTHSRSHTYKVTVFHMQYIRSNIVGLYLLTQNVNIWILVFSWGLALRDRREDCWFSQVVPGNRLLLPQFSLWSSILWPIVWRNF